MSDEQTLLAVLAAIYLADCFYWVPRGALSITRWRGQQWKLRFPSPLLGNQTGSFGLANPLPPLGLASRCAGIPPAVFSLPWMEIKTIERAEKRILIDGKLFHKAPSEYSARELASELARLAKLDEKQREIELQGWMHRTTDPAAISGRAAEFSDISRRLRTLANILFLFLFVAAPLVVWRFGLAATLFPLVGGIYAQTALIGWQFSKAHKKLYPRDSEQMLKPFLTMLLAAPSAIRAQDLLGRPLLELYHPLAVAKALCSGPDFETLAPKVVRDLKYPQAGANASAVFLDILTRQLNLPLAAILKAPARTEAINTRYCPRCLQQFTSTATTCADCGACELSPLDD